MEKILTISVAAYNVAETIEAAMRSCLLNSNSDAIEVLVVNDGSDDATQERAAALADQYPGVFKVINKLNGGYGSTINEGLSRAQGKFFMILDGDDTLNSHRLERLIAMLKGCTADLVVTPHTEVRSNGINRRVCDLFADLPSGQYAFDDIFIDVKAAMHSYIFNTDILRSSGFQATENCFYTDSEVAILPMAFVYSVAVLHEPVYEYHLGVEGQSVSIEGMRKHGGDALRVFNSLMDGYVNMTDLSPVKRAYYIKNISIIASFCYELMFVQRPSMDVWKRLVAFDRALKEYSEMYDSDVYLGKTALFRASRYLAYPICVWRALR